MKRRIMKYGILALWIEFFAMGAIVAFFTNHDVVALMFLITWELTFAIFGDEMKRL